MNYFGRCQTGEGQAQQGFVGGVVAWLRAAWNSPSMALRLRGRFSKRTQGSDSSSESSLKGRYGDEWIGPGYRNWMLVPNGSSRLEIRFQAPPESVASDLIIEVSIDAALACKGRFKGNAELALVAALPDQRGEMVEVRINCSRFFIPKEQGLSEDSRELSVKLVETRWF